MVGEHASAAIEFLCTLAHDASDQSGVTVHEGRWAYCAGHGNGGHTWEAIPPTALADLQRRRHTERASGRTVAPILPLSIPTTPTDGQPLAVAGADAAPTVARGRRDEGSVGARAKRAR